MVGISPEQGEILSMQNYHLQRETPSIQEPYSQSFLSDADQRRRIVMRNMIIKEIELKMQNWLNEEQMDKLCQTLEETLKNASYLLKATPENLADKITHMLAENKTLHSEVESLKNKMAQDAAGDVMDQVKEVKGVKLLAAQLDGIDMNGLRDLGDQFKAKMGEGVVVLASGNDGKVSLMATATDGAVKQGAHAGNLVKAIAGCVGGGGGGRPNMAQAGGKNPAGIPDALAKASEVLESQIR